MKHWTCISWRWLLLFVLSLFLTGCPQKVDPVVKPDPPKPDDTPKLILTLSSPFSEENGNWKGEVPAEGLSAYVYVTSSADWSASSSASWCTVNPASGTPATNQITLKVDPTDSEKERNGEITFRSGTLSSTIRIQQKAVTPFSLSPSEIEIEAAGGEFQVKVSCSTGYKLNSCPEWVTQVGTPTNKTHKFKVQPNPDFEPRSGVIVFCDDKSLCLPVSVRQKAREGTPPTTDWSKEFYRRSLYMDFTGTWCGFCPRMARGLSLVKEEIPDRIIDVEIHDDGSILFFNGCPPLQSFFNIHSFPTGVIDMRRLIHNSGNEKGVADRIRTGYQESAAAIKAVSAIGLSSTLSGQDLVINTDLFLKKSGDYKVTVVVLEKGLVTSQSDYDFGNNPNYLHHDVARIAVTDIMGVPVSAGADNTVKSLTHTVSIPSSYKKENLKVLVYVQRLYGSSVSKIDANDFDGGYIDNCVVAPVGVTVSPALVSGTEGGGNEDFTNGKPINW